MRLAAVVAGLGCGGEAAAAEAASGSDAVAALVGGGAGLNGIGGLPAPIYAGHLGGGWRTQRWLAAGLVSYSSTEGEAALGDWSIVRREVQVLGLFAMRPFPARAFHLHAQLGVGPAFDQLRRNGVAWSARTTNFSAGAGPGWGPAALTLRYVTPEPRVCTHTGSCYQTGGGVQLLLSLTFDVAALARGGM